MEFKTNERYFAKRFTPLYVGIPMALLGFANTFYYIFVDSLFLYNFFVATMIVGILMVVFFFVSLVKDSELDRGVNTRIRDIADAATEKMLAHDKHARAMESYMAESYVFDGENLLFKKGRDGSIRSNRYAASVFLLGAKKLYVYSLTFSLTDSFENELLDVYDYADIKDIKMEGDVLNLTPPKGKKAYENALYAIKVVSSQRTGAYPTHNDSMADSMITKVLHRREKVETA